MRLPASRSSGSGRKTLFMLVIVAMVFVLAFLHQFRYHHITMELMSFEYKPSDTPTTEKATEMEDVAREREALATKVKELSLQVAAKDEEIKNLRLQENQKDLTTIGNGETKAKVMSEPEEPNNSDDRPEFPATKYTPHVNSLLEIIDTVTLRLPPNASRPWPFDPHRYCPNGYHIFVDKPYSPPTAIECHPDGAWCAFFRKLFGDNPDLVLPFNVTVGESSADMIKEGSMAWGQCFGSSGPKGGFSMNNFQDVKAQMEIKDPKAIGYTHTFSRPWEERHKIPVFRGHPRMPGRCSKEHVSSGGYGPRSQAVWFSLEHPDLMNARVSSNWNKCIVHNATNGMDRVFGLGQHARKDEIVNIPSSEFYTDYQVAVVFAGIGAAFRTTVHLSAGQALVLHRSFFEEWYVPYMEPWVHYIPLKEDLSDMKEVMEWVRDNPKKVKTVGENGKKFYDEWLEFPETRKHWHELFWRLSELVHDKGPERLKTGTLRTIWPHPFVPFKFIRGEDGQFVAEERSITRQPYLDFDIPLGLGNQTLK